MFYTVESFDTEFSADSVEWCPSEDARDYFVCGTYQLSQNEEAGKKKRLGKIYLFQVIQNIKLNLVQQLKVPGILDMKWAHAKYRGKILLGVVNSNGHLEIFELNNSGSKFSLTLTWSVLVQDDVLALSLDWSIGKYLMQNDINNDELKITVSDSKGCITVFEIKEDGIAKVCSWLAHEFEAWITAFDYWNSNILFSGGDDCKFQRFDIRIGEKPTAISRTHSAGVTSLHSNAKKEHVLASGSYDEVLRIWDTRNFKSPLGETNLGGGIWRVKWEPFERQYLLAACMYDGFRIIDCQNSEMPNICATYKEHESISYGCDWSMLTACDIKDMKISQQLQHPILVATCSFYDHTLKLSAVDLQIEL